MSKPISLGTVDGSGMIVGLPLDVQVDSRGQFWVSRSQGPPQVFDSSGRFVRLAGVEGDGPGEYSKSTRVRILHADSILLIDASRNRATIMTPDFRVVRSFNIRSPFRNLAVIGRTIVGSGYVATPDRAGLPLHLIPLDGQPVNGTFAITKSLSPDSAIVRSAMHLYSWVLARGQRNTFWSADLSRYRLTRWTEAGVPAQQLLRRPVWFAGTSTAYPGGTNSPPHPFIQAIHEDSDGLLWTATWSVAPTWREGWAGVFRGATASGSGIEGAVSAGPDVTKLYMTNVEVLDPSSGVLVTQLATSDLIFSLLTGNRAAIYNEDDDGTPTLKIVSLTLEGRR